MQPMSKERDSYISRIDRLFRNPEVTRECLLQYDARERAQARLAEHISAAGAQAELYRMAVEERREAVRKMSESEKREMAAVRKLEETVLMLKECQAGYADAVQETDRLKDINGILMEENAALKGEIGELRGRLVEAVDSGKRAQDRLEGTEAENGMLHARVRSLQEQIGLCNKDRYGAATEQTGRIFVRGEEEDPLGEDAASGDEPENGEDCGIHTYTGYSAGQVLKLLEDARRNGEGGAPKERSRHRDRNGSGKRKPWKRGGIFGGIDDHVDFYNYNFEELDRKYGEGNYRIISFTEKRTIGETKPHNYVLHEYRPVVLVKRGDGTEAVISEECETNLYPHSFVSESLFSSLCVKRYGMSLPLYRIEGEYRTRGIALSRKTMCNWIMHFALDVFGPVYDWMVKGLKDSCPVQQCDETTWRLVIWPEGDEPGQGKRNGSRGYVWVHTSGEFKTDHRLVVYSFEKTRNADHLRKYIGKLVRYLVSDAYSGYTAIEKERGGALSVCNCWMHCRRAWAKAVLVMEPGIDGMPAEELVECIPVKGLLLANAIFGEDTPLKSLGADGRKAGRLVKVAPHVDAFFEFVHGIDMDDPAVDGKLKEAVTYALNQEERLRVFLEDGNIPIDNGYAERCVKPIALSRKNSLFSYSLAGAQCSMIMYTLVETAKANGADVYTYIKYLLKEMPKHQEDTDLSFLDDMMPWAAKYRVFEKSEKDSHADEKVPESNAPPPGVRRKSGQNTVA